MNLPLRVREPTGTPYRLRLHPDVARELGRYISPIVAKVRAAFDDRAERDVDERDALVIDLSGATNVPCVQLILLVKLLRSALGRDVAIILSGLSPMLLGPLVAFEIPEDVTLIDSGGRRWPA